MDQMVDKSQLFLLLGYVYLGLYHLHVDFQLDAIYGLRLRLDNPLFAAILAHRYTMWRFRLLRGLPN